MAFPLPINESNLEQSIQSASQWDAVILIAPDTSSLDSLLLKQTIAAHQRLDARIGKEPVLMVSSEIAGGRLVFAPTGPLGRDYDDVRRFSDAAKKAIVIARDAGARKPLLMVAGVPDRQDYAHSLEVAYLGACQALWQPLEAREALGEKEIEPVEAIGLLARDKLDMGRLVALEAGKRVARDLCGTEPERMAPPRFAEYCEKAFTGSAVSVSVLSDDTKIRQDYPLLHAVARASTHVERHQPRVIRLEYQGEGEIQQTLLFAGKGLTYDTGGADLKVDGHMAGMSRDKGGAAAVAGFMQTLAQIKPKGIRVIAEIGAVRNSIGSDAFVADEIITSHAGKRVRIGNTDAEGRLVLADLLSHLREDAKAAVNPSLFSIATLTGHAARAVGGYTAYVENGPARAAKCSQKLTEMGDLWGDPGEVSRSRREDYHFIRPRSKADDLLSCNNAPSSATPRGHQFPMAFLAVASGLDAHGIDSTLPMPYVHIDIAGSGVDGGDWQHDMPSGAPVVALAARYLGQG
ncbi:leucyl aminopeptidase family protein [Aliiglaciecola sp. CAU 1673]|uniref:M17 family metallopeptidase n=1 Tax=Aliiglaciecola sp. CAU 1673 TaxID=3032595 RepID=UPI0023DCD5B6|nr:leucyl aminopeptidase family protein [Aliiglaciecola sp. CAU 1673]MDF2176804.1 leucyl aminopeptidase family protein [Aliiglaciecola sp. CAU 1673]